MVTILHNFIFRKYFLFLSILLITGCNTPDSETPEAKPIIIPLGKYRTLLKTENMDATTPPEIELEFLENNQLIQRAFNGETIEETKIRWKLQGQTVQFLNSDRKERIFKIKQRGASTLLIDGKDTLQLTPK